MAEPPLTQEDVSKLFDYYVNNACSGCSGDAVALNERLYGDQDQLIALSSWNDHWSKESDEHTGLLIPKLLSERIAEYAKEPVGPADEDRQNRLLSQVKLEREREAFIAGFFGFTALEGARFGMEALEAVSDTAKEVIGVASLVLPLTLAGSVLLGASAFLGLYNNSKEERGFKKYIELYKTWNELPEAKRLIVCETLDRKQELPPGSSYDFLNGWLSRGRKDMTDAQLVESLGLRSAFNDDIIQKVQLSFKDIDELKDIVRKQGETLEEHGARINALEQQMTELAKRVDEHDKRFDEFGVRITEVQVMTNEDRQKIQELNQRIKKNNKGSINLSADDPKSHNQDGLFLMKIKRYDEALRELDISIGLDPNEPIYHRNKGLALSGLRRYEEAIGEYSIAIRLDPNDADGHNNKGIRSW